MVDLPFSRRFGYQTEASPPIKVREDAPEALRYGIVMLADDLGLDPINARLEVCKTLFTPPDANNWSPYPNVFGEVQGLVGDAPWYRVYDIAEGFHARIALSDPASAKEFQDRLNELLREHGIGWEMREGRIVARGSEAFEQALTTAKEVLETDGRLTAATEMHEALRDISRRPTPDVTGAIQHAMAALECVARDMTGKQTQTLGQIVSILGLPRPLDMALDKLWGFASEQGRHIREGRDPRLEDAELVVTVASALCVYLLRSGQGR